MSLQYGPYEPETIRILPSRSSDSRSSPLTPHSAHSSYSQQAQALTPRAIAAGAPPFPQHIAVWPAAPHPSRPPPLAHTNSAPSVPSTHASYASRRPERVGRAYSVQYGPSEVTRTGSGSSAPRHHADAYRADEAHRSEEAYRAEAAYREERTRGRDRDRERRQSEHHAQSVRRPYYDEYDERGPARTRSMSRAHEAPRGAEPTQHAPHRPRTQSTRSYTAQSARGAQHAQPSGTKLQVVMLDGEYRKAHASAAHSPASTGHAPVAQYFPHTKKTSFLAKLFGKGGEDARPRW